MCVSANTQSNTQPNAGRQFDVVIASEVVEHVAQMDTFIQDCARVVAPGGVLVVSTLNRTAKAHALAIVVAENVLKWAPPGTHDHSKFVTPDELVAVATREGMSLVDVRGMTFSVANQARAAVLCPRAQPLVCLVAWAGCVLPGVC